MLIENTFDVASSPETVYAFLLDINRVAGCVPGVQLTEVVDADTFNGKVRIKVGPITVAYNGTARIAERDTEAHTALIKFSGRETTGPGGTEGSATMSVKAAEGHSHIKVAADFVVRGRVANFGRGVMEDVSRRLVGQMADCIKAQLEAESASAASVSSEAGAGPQAAAPSGAAEDSAAGSSLTASTPAASTPAASTPPAAGRPVNALSLFFAILGARIRALFGRRTA